MSGVIRATGWIVSLALMMLSLYSIISSGEVGYQSWIFLLLIPFSVALALSSKGGEIDSKNIYFDHLALLLAVMMVFLTLSNKLSLSILLGAAGFGGFFLFLRIIGWYIYKREAVGMGDIQLGIILGMPLVWQDIVLTLYITFISASFIGLYQLYQRQQKNAEIALIPFISLGFMISLLYGPQIREYLGAWYYG